MRSDRSSLFIFCYFSAPPPPLLYHNASFCTCLLQLSQRAREIYNSFLSSKATTPVNIDSQAQLADDILNAPRPDMFKEQQLQVAHTHTHTKLFRSPRADNSRSSIRVLHPSPAPFRRPSTIRDTISSVHVCSGGVEMNRIGALISRTSLDVQVRLKVTRLEGYP